MKIHDSAWVIIDTSAFIEANHKPHSFIAKQVTGLIEAGLAAVTPLVFWEMGRGKLSTKDRLELQAYLNSLERLHWEIQWDDLEDLDRQILKNGFSVPFTDLWIARTAIEHQAFLLHQDKHYTAIAKSSALKIWNPS